MNAKQRSKWISRLISEMQLYLSRNRGETEQALVEASLRKLDEARTMANQEREAP
jgi:hypothetical protein